MTQFSQCVFTEPYTYSQQLYDKLIETYDHHYSIVFAKQLKQSQKTGHIISFLKEWCQMWQKGVWVVNGLNKMFMYLDRFHVPNSENLLPTKTVGYISFYCNVFQLFAHYAKDCVLRLIEMKRRCMDDYDVIIHETLFVFKQMHQYLKNKVLLNDLSSNKYIVT